MNGGPLILEDLDLSGLGLYLESQVDVNDPDCYLSGYTSLGRLLYYKRSDVGIKRYIYGGSKLVDWSKFLKKEQT